MTDPPQHLVEGSSQVADVTEVVRALHRVGPLSLHELARVPGLDTWPGTRLEQAVIIAWSRDLITVNFRDELIAL
jgi:hypothetical protein